MLNLINRTKFMCDRAAYKSNGWHYPGGDFMEYGDRAIRRPFMVAV